MLVIMSQCTGIYLFGSDCLCPEQSPCLCYLDVQTVSSSFQEYSAGAPQSMETENKLLSPCIKASKLKTKVLIIVIPDLLYPWLSAGIMKDGHGVWVRNSMTYEGGTKDPGQVAYIHLSV